MKKLIYMLIFLTSFTGIAQKKADFFKQSVLGWANISASTSAGDFDVTGTVSNPGGLFFKPDGTKMYTTHAGTVYQWTLSTAWDVTSASYDSVNYVTTAGFSGFGLYIVNSGTKAYIMSYQRARVYEMTLSTAWDFSTASTITFKEFGPGSIGVFSKGIALTEDGTKLFIFWINDGTTSQYISQHTLSTPYSISTAGSATATFDVISQIAANSPRQIYVKEDGKKFLLSASYSTGNQARFFKYSMSTAWDLSTASYDGDTYEENLSKPEGVFVSPNFDRWYFSVLDSDKVYQKNF